MVQVAAVAAPAMVQVMHADITARVRTGGLVPVPGIVSAGKGAGGSRVMGFTLYPFHRIANSSTGTARPITMQTMSTINGTAAWELTSK